MANDGAIFFCPTGAGCHQHQGGKEVKEMELLRCPGTSTIITPIPTIKMCPNCEEEVEIWSNESKGRCSKCGTVIFKEEIASCIQWCPYARQCVGEEKYKQLMEEVKK